jgi:A/G-specific adenine glycosylase
MPAFRQNKINTLHTAVSRWYRKHRRELAWRSTTNPYEILISEIMLQQTQVSRVQEKLPLFLEKFPTLRSLGSASKADVLHAWRGMGYNNRAVRMRDMARIVVDRYNGKLPSDVEVLLQLPGIGPYTAHAVACFAFRKNVPVVDVNIRRVLSRLLWRMGDPAGPKNDEEVWQLAKKILPKNGYSWNQALMDLGATICKSQKPLCERCPVRSVCRSRHLRHYNLPAKFPGGKKPSEPSYHGIPQRLWRGKIVEALRNVNGKGSISMRQLGKAIKPTFSGDELPWLHLLIGKLERDGIVERVRSNIMLSKE